MKKRPLSDGVILNVMGGMCERYYSKGAYI